MSAFLLLLSLFTSGNAAVYNSTDVNYNERHIGVVLGPESGPQIGYEVTPYPGVWTDTGAR